MFIFCLKQACRVSLLLLGTVLLMVSGTDSWPAALNEGGAYQNRPEGNGFLLAGMEYPRLWNRNNNVLPSHPVGETKQLFPGDSCGTGLPEYFQMDQNDPNPFYPDTRIEVQVAEPGPVKLAVLDLLGKEVCLLIDEELSPGVYEVSWNSRDVNGRLFPGGTYLYRLVTERTHITRKMQLLR